MFKNNDLECGIVINNDYYDDIDSQNQNQNQTQTQSQSILSPTYTKINNMLGWLKTNISKLKPNTLIYILPYYISGHKNELHEVIVK